MQPHPSGPRKPQGVVPGKLNLPSRWPGEGLGGVVALDGLDDAGKGAGEEGDLPRAPEQRSPCVSTLEPAL